MITPNHLTRIEREAKEYAKKTWELWPPSLERTAHVAQSLADYSRGKIQEHARAAPVVKALEDRLKEWEAGYQAECAAIDRINKDRQKPIFWAGEDYKMNYPPIPHWVTEAKQILETYKSDV